MIYLLPKYDSMVCNQALTDYTAIRVVYFHNDAGKVKDITIPIVVISAKVGIHMGEHVGEKVIMRKDGLDVTSLYPGSSSE